MRIKKQNKKAIAIRQHSLRNTFFLLLVSCFFSLSANAQCAMCRAALESSGNKTKVEAVNDGIVFLMAIPYIIVAGIGFVIYKMYYNKKESPKS